MLLLQRLPLILLVIAAQAVFHQKTLAQSADSQAVDSQTSDSQTADSQAKDSPQENSQNSPDGGDTSDIYSIPPEVVPGERVPSLLTIMPINGFVVDHQKRLSLQGNYLFGSDRTDNAILEAIVRINSEVQRSQTLDNVFTLDIKGQYSQISRRVENRHVITTEEQPQTLNGLLIQLSFTGPCVVSNVTPQSPDSQCTLTPTLVVDRDSINPDFLIPTRIEQLGNIGDEISAESLAVIRQPGFQGVGVNNETVGLDLLFPNIGGLPGNSQSQQSEVNRKEEFDLLNYVAHYRVRQILKANDRVGALGRTIHGFGTLTSERNFLPNLAIQAVAQTFPDIVPQLASSDQPPNVNINRNLFIAANNTRLPPNSFLIYQAGIGKASHLISPEPAQNTSEDQQEETKIIEPERAEGERAEGETAEGETQLSPPLSPPPPVPLPAPPATFNTLWLGLSPVIDRSLQQSFRFVPTGAQQATIQAGAEGGSDTDIGFVSVANDQTFNSSLLSDTYTQIYLSFLEQDANFVSSQTLTEKTTYYPHLSLTGNVTSNNQAFRYYGGVIAASNPKVYLGSDYTRTIAKFRLNVGATGYFLNADQDYFSQVEGSIARTLRLSASGRYNMTLASAFHYAIDRPTEIFLSDPTDNFVSVEGRVNLGRFSTGVSQLFDLLPNSVGNKLRADVFLKLPGRIQLSAFVLPQRSIDNYGIQGQVRFSDRPGSPVFVFGWTRSLFDFGQDVLGNDLDTSNDTFSLSFRIDR